LRCGDPLLIGDLEGEAEGILDPRDMRPGLGPIVVRAFMADVDDPAGIDRVVRGVQDPVRAQEAAVTVLGELIVGGSGNDRRPDLRNRPVVEDRS
jgi:hypothetical protein